MEFCIRDFPKSISQIQKLEGMPHLKKNLPILHFTQSTIYALHTATTITNVFSCQYYDYHPLMLPPPPHHHFSWHHRHRSPMYIDM
jgi:hypothetical protein